MLRARARACQNATRLRMSEHVSLCRHLCFHGMRNAGGILICVWCSERVTMGIHTHRNPSCLPRHNVRSGDGYSMMCLEHCLVISYIMMKYQRHLLFLRYRIHLSDLIPKLFSSVFSQQTLFSLQIEAVDLSLDSTESNLPFISSLSE
jgi:hypothetical protein